MACGGRLRELRSVTANGILVETSASGLVKLQFSELDDHMFGAVVLARMLAHTLVCAAVARSVAIV
jgi:hypothetical protein